MLSVLTCGISFLRAHLVDEEMVLYPSEGAASRGSAITRVCTRRQRLTWPSRLRWPLRHRQGRQSAWKSPFCNHEERYSDADHCTIHEIRLTPISTRLWRLRL